MTVERLREVDKGVVVLDVCPGCRGAWLDRTELEKLFAAVPATAGADLLAIDNRRVAPGRSGYDDSEPERVRRSREKHDSDDDFDDQDDHRFAGQQGGKSGRGRRRGGFLNNIMDMFGD